MFVTLALVAATAMQAQKPAAAPDLTDPEVAHVAVTANAIDVDLAKFAQARTRTPAVRTFAQTMITDHNAVNAQAAALARKLGVTPAENPVSESLLTGAADARTKLGALEGAAFDRAYMDREVGYHQAVLDALDQVLIPTTENAELKQLLLAVRPAIAEHLEHARHLRTELNSSGTGN